MKQLSDTQNAIDKRGKEINQVGIKDLLYPLIFEDSGIQRAINAKFKMTVGLASNQKGTHMSRFIEVLNDYQKQVLSIQNFDQLVQKVLNQLESQSAQVSMNFDWFKEKSAPISGIKSLLNYRCKLICRIVKDQIINQIKIIVPVKSLCPCSKSISKYGAHNQRSYIAITITSNKATNLTDLINLAEQNASADLYALLKRTDEKYITEKAYDRPLFVEDIVREIALKLDLDKNILSYDISSENIESIHNHSAYARIYSDDFQPL